MITTNYFLRDIWYYALPGTRLKQNKTLSKTILGEPILFGRTQTGKVFALRDLCPHRGVPLSFGRFDGSEVECCYHGWRFDTSGVCQKISSLASGQDLDLNRFKVKRYLVEEVQGNIWIYMSTEDRIDPPTPKTEIPIVPYFEGQSYRIVDSVRFSCHVDHAVIGLMDPTHAIYVHNSWWWQGRRELYETTQAFAPSTYGFTMLRHKIPQIPRIIKLVMGDNPEDEISFQLPGIRIEKMTTQKHNSCNLTAVTPISETETEVTFVLYWTDSIANFFKPLLQPLIKEFLNQDGDLIKKQQIGLQYDPKLMLIKDADTQARWYYQLKAEYDRAILENRPFINPVPETSLSWRY